MNLLWVLENGLFAIGQLLRLPVMALLWICVLAVVAMAGWSLAELVRRRRERLGMNIERWLRAGPVLTADATRRAELTPALRAFVESLQEQARNGALDEEVLAHAVMESEERARTILNGPRLLVKAAPSLGLVGTLIPMGGSMAAMANGNLAAMAGEMVVAFTTTIIGIACGTAAFVILMVRQGWLSQALREQRFVAEKVLGELGTPQ